MTPKYQQAAIGELFIASNPALSAADAGSAAHGVPELALQGERREIVFIMDDVADIDTLVQGIGSGKEVFVLDAHQDGLRQMADILEGRSGIAALHVISHGKQGSVSLGTSLLDTATLDAHGPALQAIGRSMASGGDILLYGCDVGAGAAGLALVSALSMTTGADIAASDDLTGAAALGGDWELEIRSGDIESHPVVSPELAALYQNTLAVSSFNVSFSRQGNFSYPGSVNGGASDDVVYRLDHPSGYQFLINGATQNIYAGIGYVQSDSYGNGESSIEFSFVGKQIFTPTSLKVISFDTMRPTQKLVFRGYDADDNPIGEAFPATIPSGTETYVLVQFSGLEGIAKLKVKSDAGVNDKMFTLLFDDFAMTNIGAAGPPQPKITSVSSTTVDGAYGVGAEIVVTVTFDQAVAVAGGSPTLQLETGSVDQLAVYEDGSGSNTLRFKYTVQAGDRSTDLNYFSTGALATAGATIKGSSGGADASLVLPALNSPNSLGGGKAIVIDTTAPTLAITSSAAGTLKIGDTAVITFTFSEPVSGFVRADVQVSGGTLGNLTASQDGSSYSGTFTPDQGSNDGTASITVNQGVYTDIAGNPGSAGALSSITFDTLAPAKPLVAVLQPDSDSGALGDGITSDSTPTFSGAAGSVEKLATVRVYAGATLIAQTTANDNGSWTATSTISLDDASYQVTVRARDGAGNESVHSDAFTLVVDTAAPKKPDRPDLASGSDSGINNDNITNAVTQTIGGAANSVEGGSLVTLYSAGVPIAGATTTAAADGSWSIDLNLANGQYAITARSTDKAGNQGSASDALTLTVDQQAPGAPQAPLLHADSNSGSKADTITNDRSPTFYGVAGSVEGGATVKLYANGQPIGSVVAAANGSWSVAVNELGTGAHTITAEAVDVAGNVSAASSGTALTIDFTPPTAGVDNVAFSDDTGVAGDFVTRVANQTVSGTLTAPLEGGEWIGVSIDNGVTYSPAVVGAGGDSWSLAGVQIAGKGTLWVRVFDAAGNPGTPFSHAYQLDTAAPGKPSTPDLNDASDSGADKQDNITGVTTPTFTGTAEEGATVILYANGRQVGIGQANAGGEWGVTVDEALEGGAYAFTVRAIDLAGNQGVASDALDVTIVTASPSTTNLSLILLADSGTPGDRITNVAAQQLQGELSAVLAPGEKVQVRIADGSWQDATIVPGANGWTLDTALAQGAQEIEVQVVNAIGNAGPVSSYDYVLDTDAPTVRIESDKPALKAGETAIITLTFSDAPGAALTEEAIKVSGGTLSGLNGEGLVWTALFTPAANTNNGTASISLDAGLFSDLAGNPSMAPVPASLTFDTSRPATSAPVLAAASDTGWSPADGVTANPRPTFTGTAESGATVTLYDAMDNVIGSGNAVNGAWSIAPVANLANGKHTISARAVDVNGNASELVAGQEITIDTTPPTVTITSNVDKLKIGETATITFTFSEDPGATFTREDITVFGGTLGELEKAGLTFSATFTPTADTDATTARITVAAGSYTDRAGNNGGPGISQALAIDTRAPDAPGVPKLAADSDTGEKGDGRTESTTQVIEGGGAEPGAMVYLYNGNQRIGSGQANGDGLWSIEVALGGGAYALSVTQNDNAGNESVKSASFQLTVTASNPNPNPQPNPPTVIDGMPVTITPVTLPGGVRGTTVEVPIVTGSRNETDGQASLADIPLASSGGQMQLLAQLPVGYGLSSSGASVGAASGLGFLVAAIKAATPTHAADDQGHLVQNGTSFLQGLNYSSLLVHTVKPVSNPGTADALVLTGFNPSGAQGTALVIETAGLANGAAIALVDVDFAALVGAATVVTGSNGAMLAGDGASQHFTVVAGNNNGVFAGGGSDLLTFAARAPVDAGSANGRASAQQAAASGVATLHGGQGGDAASFAGVRGDYDIDVHNGYLVVSSKAAPDAKALVVNVEELRFGDGNLAVENGAGLTTLAGMYQTVFGRQADLYGFEYWADHRDQGISWGTIALELIASSEGVAQHGDFNGDAANDIGLLYQALFNREAEAEGLAFWKAAMEERGMSLEQVATSFVGSAEMVGHQRGVLDWDFLV